MTFETNQKPEHHRADVIRLVEENFHPHTNADNLVIIKLAGYQLVTRKDEFKPGDLAVFIQPDSVVPQTEPFKFIWEKYVGVDGTVPEKRRRITVRKFRGEWSEGLLLPVTSFVPTEGEAPWNGYLKFEDGILFGGRRTSDTGAFYHRNITEGTDVSDILNITHYVPEETNTGGESVKAPRKKQRRPKTIKGWIKYAFRLLFHRPEPEIVLDYPTYDLTSIKKRGKIFEEGERVVVTEKIHGSNARYVFVDGEQYAGSREQWKAPKSENIFNRVLAKQGWIGQWCRDHEGYVLYGEVTPTQKGYQYGDANPQFFVFDIRTPDGKWLPDHHPYWWDLRNILEVTVPELYRGPFREDLLAERNVGGQSTVEGATNIREGVVIRAEAEPRKIAKVVSNAYLDKDSK